MINCSQLKLTQEEIEHLKEAAKIWRSLSTADYGALADLTYEMEKHISKCTNRVFQTFVDDYCDFGTPFRDLAEISQALVEALPNEPQEVSEKSFQKKTVKLKDLAGDHTLSGVELGQALREGWAGKENCNYVKFTVDGTHYQAFEDPSDGYRSYCDDLETVSEPCRTPLPDIEVEIKYVDACRIDDFWTRDCDIIQFIDKANKQVILEVGTENVGDWYPSCIFHYYPENMSCNSGR